VPRRDMECELKHINNNTATTMKPKFSDNTDGGHINTAHFRKCKIRICYAMPMPFRDVVLNTAQGMRGINRKKKSIENKKSKTIRRPCSYSMTTHAATGVSGIII